MQSLDDIPNARLVCIWYYDAAFLIQGAVAQLGERMTGSHEVRGSIPLGSTNKINSLRAVRPGRFLLLCAYSVRMKGKAHRGRAKPRRFRGGLSAVEHPLDVRRGLVLHSRQHV
jgi:hypothetical protein